MLRKVAIIAGHTGPKTGACSPMYFSEVLDEGTETIWLRDHIVELLKQKYNVKAITDNNTASLSSVIAILKKFLFGEDLSIDIHFNAAAAKGAQGTEILIPNNASDFEKKAAQSLLYTITSCLDTRSRGVKSESSGQHSKLGMLSGFNAQNILVEICFCSNPDDCKKYFANRQKLVEKLTDCIYKLLNL